MGQPALRASHAGEGAVAEGREVRESRRRCSNGTVIETFNGLVIGRDQPELLLRSHRPADRECSSRSIRCSKRRCPSRRRAPRSRSSDARAAFTTLKAGASDVVRVEAKRAGRAGNRPAITVADGQAGLLLKGVGDAPSVEIIAREPGCGGHRHSRRHDASRAGQRESDRDARDGRAADIRSFQQRSRTSSTPSRTDPDVNAEVRGAVLPTALGATPLERRVTIEVITEGRDTSTYSESCRSRRHRRDQRSRRRIQRGRGRDTAARRE